MDNSIESILKERHTQYGDFKNQANLSQELKRTMCNSLNWMKIDSSKREVLEMVVHKIARILNGNPENLDSWQDIAGYITLVCKEIKTQQK